MDGLHFSLYLTSSFMAMRGFVLNVLPKDSFKNVERRSWASSCPNGNDDETIYLAVTEGGLSLFSSSQKESSFLFRKTLQDTL